MARKKKETTMETGDPPAAVLPEAVTATTPPEPPPQPADPLPAPPLPQPTPNGPRRPVASWKFPAAGGVTIEVALWPHAITLQSGETVEVLNATVTRCYKDQHGQWQRGGSFRVAELPVLAHALGRAHAFALDAREMSCPI